MIVQWSVVKWSAMECDGVQYNAMRRNKEQKITVEYDRMK